MINPQTNKPFGVITMDNDKTNKVTGFTFEYVSADTGWGRAKWKRSKKRFENMDDAVRASGLWMQICFDNDWPIAVRLVEV
jgi:hypothetical protein